MTYDLMTYDFRIATDPNYEVYGAFGRTITGCSGKVYSNEVESAKDAIAAVNSNAPTSGCWVPVQSTFPLRCSCP